MVGAAAKCAAVAHLKALIGLSERRVCMIVDANRKMICYLTALWIRSRGPGRATLPTSGVGS